MSEYKTQGEDIGNTLWRVLDKSEALRFPIWLVGAVPADVLIVMCLPKGFYPSGVCEEVAIDEEVY